jgi:hypothetical protein
MAAAHSRISSPGYAKPSPRTSVQSSQSSQSSQPSQSRQSSPVDPITFYLLITEEQRTAWNALEFPCKWSVRRINNLSHVTSTEGGEPGRNRKTSAGTARKSNHCQRTSFRSQMAAINVSGGWVRQCLTRFVSLLDESRCTRR